MGKVGNYITGLSVAAVMAGSPASAEAQENVTNNNENGNKIEYVQDNLRDELKNDSTVAWETVAGNVQQLKEPSKDSSRDDTAQEMRKDGVDFSRADSIFNDYSNKIRNAIQNNEPDEKIDSLYDAYDKALDQELDRRMKLPKNMSPEECASEAVYKCMTQQTSHKVRIFQQYDVSEAEYEKMQAEGKIYLYGDFLEYLATSGDKKLGKALGISEEEMTPENITMALAYGPKIPYEKQEQLYKEALEDGRVERYKENSRSIAGNRERYPELSIEGEQPKDAARLHIDIEKSQEFADKIIERYGENANALLIKAFTCDKELAEKMGFKDEKPDAQQLVYMLANAEPLSKEDQNKMVTEQDRVVADKVLDHMENKNHKEEYFTLNYKEQKGENSVQSVVDMVRGEQTADKTKSLGDKLKEDLANIHPKTEKANDNAMTNVAINMAMQQKGGR